MIYETEATALIDSIAETCRNKLPICSLSASIYDTAWVSMISRSEGAICSWLFPECFEAILQSDIFGCVDTVHSSTVDSILNTGAVLLAVLWHRRHSETVGCPSFPQDTDLRISSISSRLQGTLDGWDVVSSNHVGFEILVPALLQLLAGEGLKFDFSGRQSLYSLYEQKLSRFSPEILYSDTQLTMVHSLEALVGKIDFDRVAHHVLRGSGMMASPSATAAYLIYSSTWDHRAENYLRLVLAHFKLSPGNVPSAFPTTNFELTWVSV